MVLSGLALIVCNRGVWARSGTGQSSAPLTAMGSKVKTTEEVYKNIQVLRGVPADQLNPTMRLVALSLGVQCSFCHVEGADDKDDKQEKQTARRMMQMMLAINKDNFNGRVQITCYTCHRGNPVPVGTPVIVGGTMRPTPTRSGNAGGANQVPSTDQLLDMYLRGIGGMDAISRISTRVSKGKSQEAGDRKSTRLNSSHIQKSRMPSSA